jgi:hypothetical protein
MNSTRPEGRGITSASLRRFKGINFYGIHPRPKEQGILLFFYKVPQLRL